MASDQPRCDECGRFFSVAACWKMIYSGVIPTPEREIYRCVPCYERVGSFVAQDGIRPEFSVGLMIDPIEKERTDGK